MLWTHSHIVFENSAHVMHFRICCATILVIFCPLKDFVMHRHITYYTQSTVCQGRFSNKFLSSSSWAYAGFAIYVFLGGWGIATRGVAMRLLGGFGGMLPRKIFLNCAIWCVLEHIFINFLLSKSLKISFFLQKNYKL